MATTEPESPFHQGEQTVQLRMGVREIAEELGSKFIRSYLTDQHRQFYAQLPYLLVGSVDESGRPWASILAGRPGFLSSPNATTLNIQARPIFGDPLQQNLISGTQLGILGIEYRSRRRNRMTGKVKSFDDASIQIEIDQAFGNCPQYIQSRDFEVLPEVDSIGEERPVLELQQLNAKAREIISKADNFYIATHYSESSEDVRHGADVSHRGGKPGFVRIEDDNTIKFPDFRGNNHFNTLGNIELNPRAGLLFIDFENGDLLYLTCKAEVIWDNTESRDFDGAERIVKFTMEEGRIVENALPIRWNLVEYSPSLEATGSWDEVDEKQAALSKGNQYQDYQVFRVEQESEVIKSFYLKPADGSKIHCHSAGQFLPIEVTPAGETKSIQRTYTISNAPNGEYFRLSIKREPPREPGLPAGLSSNYLHDHVEIGSNIRAMSPRGKFVLEESTLRPVVLISGGVGITPMISMLQQLHSENAGCGCERQVWFLHAARNSGVHAFGSYLKGVAKDWPSLHLHIAYSNPRKDDIEGEHYHSKGYVDISLLKSLLPLDDYDFYYCGPPPFMDGLYHGMKSLNITDERIHFEFFGPAITPRAPSVETPQQLSDEIAEPVKVKFAKSGVEAIWDPAKGTLLDLAESEGLQPMYSCRSGICQTCSTRVVEGEVGYAEPPMVEPNEGEALICCSYPKAESGSNDSVTLVLDL